MTIAETFALTTAPEAAPTWEGLAEELAAASEAVVFRVAFRVSEELHRPGITTEETTRWTLARLIVGREYDRRRWIPSAVPNDPTTLAAVAASAPEDLLFWTAKQIGAELEKNRNDPNERKRWRKANRIVGREIERRQLAKVEADTTEPQKTHRLALGNGLPPRDPPPARRSREMTPDARELAPRKKASE